jgi:hypothetical protein
LPDAASRGAGSFLKNGPLPAKAGLAVAKSREPSLYQRMALRAFPARIEAPGMLFLFVSKQFRTQNRFTFLLELL